MTKPLPWMTSDILKATRGELVCGDPQRSFSQISIDSRTISPDSLFVAIVGDRHDGHSFVADLIRRGVRGFVINKQNAFELPIDQWKQNGLVCVVVPDSKKSLGDLAALRRRRSKVSVVAITGSNGKTSTKDMTTAVISRRFDTLATQGNLNNEIGLPLTLFRLCPNHRWAVLELGMNRPGEIGRLGEICRPDIGVITNIGPAHLEGLGSIDGVMHAKGELFNKLHSDGAAVINADDPHVLRIARGVAAHKLYYGLSETATIRAESIRSQAAGTSFCLMLPAENITISLATPGGFMVSNSLAAAAVGHLIGLSGKDIKVGLENFRPASGRMNMVRSEIGIHIIDDTYNANPVSMEAALQTLRNLKGENRGIFVAGDMLELGSHTEAMHRHIGSLAAKSNIARLCVTGKFAQHVAAGARDADMETSRIFTGEKQEIIQDLIAWLRPGDWVLVKGSRGAGMEEVVKELKEINQE
ncbi:UDP-N-acetylmuramoyl-tripeptide--D-alanyl-D-alanine ligase [Thermodesulfobacteriota bacterium]